jgi:hypothetical protein
MPQTLSWKSTAARPEAFTALDYFFDDQQALRYATHWGRIWVDMKT